MATIETALVTLLNASAPVTAIIAGRLFPMAVPQAQTRPAIAYQRISNDEPMTQSGWSGQSVTRIQLTLEGVTYDQAKDLSAKVRTVLRGYRGTVGGISIGYTYVETDQDGAAGVELLPIVRTDVIFWHNGE